MKGNNPTIFLLLENDVVFAIYGSSHPTRFIKDDDDFIRDNEFFVAQLMYNGELIEKTCIKNVNGDAYDVSMNKSKDLTISSQCGIIGISNLFEIQNNMKIEILNNLQKFPECYEIDGNLNYLHPIQEEKRTKQNHIVKIVQIIIGDWQ